jgi:[ribosomal protein S5]-alanine N-acetyltransferase
MDQVSRHALAPQLRSQNLTLSPYREADFPDVARIVTDPRVIWWRDRPMEEPAVRKFFDRAIAAQADGFAWWLVRDHSNTLLGQAALWPLSSRADTIEVGYHFLLEARGRGYATEAASTLLEYGFGPRNLPEIHAIVLPQNAPSQAVMRRVGMPKVGTHVHAGLEHDLFRLRQNEWAARR